MRPHTLIDQESPSKVLKTFQTTSDPRAIAYGIDRLNDFAASPSALIRTKAHYKVEDMLAAIMRPNSRGCNAVYRIMDSGASLLSTQISGSRRLQIARKRVEVVTWLIAQGKGGLLFEPQGSGKISPFSKFLIEVQAWHRTSPTTSAIIGMAKAQSAYNEATILAELATSLAPKVLEKITTVLRA